jgi:Kef-type K+ transport system membrane component KefB
LCRQLYPAGLPDYERMVAALNFDNLVAVLAVAAAVPLILAAVPRVPVPGPVLEIVAGIVLGPAVLGLVKPDQAVRLVSTIGLAFLLFLAGLEIDVRHFCGPRACSTRNSMRSAMAF